MYDFLIHLFECSLTPHDLTILDYDDLKAYVTNKRRERNKYVDVLHRIQECNIEYGELFLQSRPDFDNYALIDPLDVFMELVCFFSSINTSITSLQGKKVLCIGANYGIEVVLLHAFGIEVYGIEQHEEVFNWSMRFLGICNEGGISIPKESLIYGDILHYTDFPVSFDYIIARNMNPLADVPHILTNIQKLLPADGIGVIQWDALYREDEALSLYAPKHDIYYNEVLRSLLDSLYIHCFNKKKLRARFLYTIHR